MSSAPTASTVLDGSIVNGSSHHRSPPVLVVFDFDHTVVHANSDTWVHKAAPGGCLPPSVKDLYRDGDWTGFMNQIFAYMSTQGVTADQMRAVMESIPWTPGMPELLDFLHAHPSVYDVVIASDANAHFIDWILRTRASSSPDKFRAILTNGSTVDGAGNLRIVPQHQHSCGTCNYNLCKRAALAGLLAKLGRDGASGRPYRQVLYMGDGSNDLCPIQAMGVADVAFPRVGFKLHSLLCSQAAGEGGAAATDGTLAVPEGVRAVESARVAAQVVPWVSGLQILGWIQQHVHGAHSAGSSRNSSAAATDATPSAAP